MALTRKEITAMRKAEYPLNLLYMVQNCLDGKAVEINTKAITEDMIRGLEYALSMLDERGAKILKKKYEEKLTTTELVEMFGVKSVNTIADSAVHKLSKPPMIGYIVYGKDRFDKMLAEYRSTIPDVLLDKPLEDLEIYPGARWAFRDLGITTLKEIVYPTDELLIKIADALSYMNIESIQKFLREMNIVHPLWSLVDKKEKSYPNAHPQAGDLYKTITLGGTDVDIRYMDYDEENLGVEIDYEVKTFEEHPEYTKDGFAFRNSQDDTCDYYIPREEDSVRNHGCEACAYLSDRNNFIGVCGCTARRQRGVKTPLTGKEMHVAIVGELPVAQEIILDEYKNVIFHHYESAADMSVIRQKNDLRFDLVLIRCNEIEAFGDSGLIIAHKVNGKTVQTPVRLISEPPSYEAELDVAGTVVSIAKKINRK